MPISVDTIRGLTSKYVVFDSQREALDKAGVGHHIANFFGSKAAKSVNRETMNAIKTRCSPNPDTSESAKGPLKCFPASITEAAST